MATITGTAGNDVLIGTAGDDTYTGFYGGSDVVYDFGGYDTYIMDVSFDALVDQIQDDLAGTETLIFPTGQITFNGAGFDGNNSWGAIEQVILSDFLFKRGTAGNDLMDYSAQGHRVSLESDEGNDTVIGSAFNDELGSNGGDDLVIAGGGDDLLNVGGGDAGVDTVDGGSGYDTLVSQDGGNRGLGILLADPETNTFMVSFGDNGGLVYMQNVELVVASAGIVQIGSAAGEALVGADGVYAGNDSNQWMISANDTLFGMGGDDSLTGAMGNDFLDGGTGVDVMSGGDGDDMYWVDNVGDIVSDTAGMDVINSSLSLTLGSGIEGLMLAHGGGALSGAGNSANNSVFGNESGNLLEGRGGNDFIEAGDGNDTLNGGLGADVMQGGNGNDSYYLDNVADQVNEYGGGYDVVYSTISFDVTTMVNPFGNTWIGIEKFVLQGTGNLTLSDYASADTHDASRAFVGNDGANTLSGFNGNDTLDGGLGVDMLLGGTGHDVYYIGNATDVIVENAGEGQDAVFSTVSFTLANNVEHLVLSGTASAGTGNGSGNTLLGNEAINNLKGLAGNDTLEGAGGADSLDGGDGNDYVSGGAGADSMKGGAGNDTLVGGAGNDTLAGAGGNDLLVGGVGADRFLFSTAPGETNLDHIQSFTTASDQLQMDDAVFTGLTLGVLAAAKFVAGTDALDSADRVMYDAASGSLYYDADGNGVGAKVLFAVIDDHSTIVASDILVV